MRALPPAAYLRECFDYDAETGVLTWRARPLHHFKSTHSFKKWNTRYAHKPAGTAHLTGYLHTGVNGRLFVLHRLIWKLVTGFDPVDQLDHINQIKTDNRWANLRPATASENRRNKPGKTPFKGVTKRGPNSFEARIGLHRKYVTLGFFPTARQAHEAYRAAVKEYHGEFAYY